MKSSLFLAAIGTASIVHGQRPPNTSVCDYYSNALLGASNATSQLTLLTLLVNTAVIGNYTTPNKLAVPGILASNATYNGTTVNLVRYFDGSMKSSNIGGSGHGVAVNFLDGGGAAPLKANKPANDESSHQYTLLTHLYSFFGLLLGCSDVGQPPFSAYSGESSMYEVHKFMALDAYEVQFFIQQVGLSAASFGVAMEDVESVGQALQALFGYRCAPKTSFNGFTKPELQSICIASDCPESPNATCKAYGHQPETTSSTTMPASGSVTPSSSGTGGATALALPMGVMMIACGLTAILI